MTLMFFFMIKSIWQERPLQVGKRDSFHRTDERNTPSLPISEGGSRGASLKSALILIELPWLDYARFCGGHAEVTDGFCTEGNAY